MTTHATDRSTIAMTHWRVGPDRSTVAFRVKMLWGLATVKGRFARFHGSLDLSAAPAIDLTIEAASLETGNDKRDGHLRSPDFFDANAHPYVRFVSETATLDGERLAASGVLHVGDGAFPLRVEATVRPVGDGLEIASVTTVVYPEIGMSWGKSWIATGMVSRKARVLVQGRLVRSS